MIFIYQFYLQVNLCQKLFFLENMGRTCCVQKLFWMSETISVHNMFFPGLSLEFSCIELVIYKCSLILLTSLIRHLLIISLKVAKSTSVFLSGISSLSKTTKLGNKSFSSLFNWGRSYLSEYSINQLMTIVKGGVIFLKNPNKYKIFSRRKQIFTK